jgi:hypothetical protein
MTQNQKPTSSRRRRDATIRIAHVKCLLLITSALLRGQVSNVQIEATSMQAVISYSAPDSNPCSMDVREANSQNPLVHDVDPSLFPGSNLDNRPGNLSTGLKRVFVVGQRTAVPALDGRRYSRALQTDTDHVATITCSNGAVTLTRLFRTMNSPLGSAVNDPLPADPNQPGQYAWPTVNWADRTQKFIDPQTGFLVKLLDFPRDSYITIGPGTFVSASNLGGGSDWTSPASAIADDTAAATYSGTTQGWMFLELGLAFGNSSLHSASTGSTNSFVPTFNAWCSSSDCATASSGDRSIQFCITIDGVTCASDMLQQTLAACLTNCTGSVNRFAAMTNPQPLLADWFVSNHINTNISAPALSKRGGNVNRTGASVVLTNGDRFNLLWGAGSTITINGTAYTIASVDSDGTMTLSGSPSGTDTNASYTGSNAGLLIRKLTAGTQQISVQSVSYAYELGDTSIMEASGDEDSFANCGATQVAGPGGEMGWHCQVSESVYWIGSTTGTISRLGRVQLPFDGGNPGWHGTCSTGASFWDTTDPNSMYCPINGHNGHLLMLKMTYSGPNTDIGDLGEGTPVVLCGSPPCWRVTNLTTPGNELDTQIKNFHPAWAAFNFKPVSYAVFGRTGTANSLMFMVRRDGSNDTMAFLFKYNLNTQLIDAGMPSWAYWPARWAGLHGPLDMNNPTWGDLEIHALSGNLFAGANDIAGNGPYYSTVVSGAIPGTGSVCPPRPSNSPIAANDWPSGNKCIQVTVDGEPGDPSPAYNSDGTITSSGANITGNGTSWNSTMDQDQMLIGSNFYTFTFVDATHGTLSPTPDALTASAYKLYLEPVNNPKVGNPNFAYLQDAAPRDVWCITPPNTFSGCNGLYPPVGFTQNEYVRLILKSGNTWTLQRGYAGTNPTTQFLAVPASSWIVAQPASCYFNPTFPCSSARVVWDFIHDPFGFNASQTTVIKDTNDQGCCHATFQGVSVDIANNTCVTRDGNSGGCYSVRFAAPPQSFTAPVYNVSINPLFHGLAGVGYVNPVDTHPAHTQFVASDNENGWVGEARPFLGDDSGTLTGSANSPGVQLSGNLYKFTASQTARLRPRFMPTMAACGANPLLDVSGPASAITGDVSNSYKYCIANGAGECVSGSSVGDVYVNCPQIRLPYCSYQGVGSADPETRDICVADMGAYTLSVNQVGIRKADPDGKYGRRLTHAFSHYHWLNQFWNPKMLPDGRSMLVWSLFLGDLRTAVLWVKTPPFPAPDGVNRGDYIPAAVKIAAPLSPGVDNAIVQFGYSPSYFCTSRQDICLQGSGSQFAYKSENPNGVPCSSGCTIPIPAISQRILYYQVILRDVHNAVLKTMSPEVLAIK